MEYFEDQESFAKQLISAFRTAKIEAENEFNFQQAAASKIQAAYHGFVSRQNMQFIVESAIRIQAAIKRRKQVLFAQQLYDCYQYLQRHQFYAAKAAVIQKHWRGLITRKHIADVSERNRFLSATAVASAEMADRCRAYERYCADQLVLQEKERQQKVVDQMRAAHHLASTKAQPGIYNPGYPYLKPTINGKEVEEILRDEGKKLAKTLVPKTTPKILDNLKASYVGGF